MSGSLSATSSKPSWRPIVRYDLALERDAIWLDAGDGVQSRDLGLGQASDGIMQARLLRASREASLNQTLRQGGRHFRLLLVFQGSVTLTGEQGASVVLAKGDCAHQPALGERYQMKLSAGAEVLDLFVEGKPLLGDQAFDLETPQQAPQLLINRDVPSAYIKGDGPRSYFLYRDLGVAAATGRRVHIHALKATAQAPAGGTGFHTHSMCQLFYVYQGWADLETRGRSGLRMVAGDAMCIAAGTHHNVPEFSSDYAIIEVCIPADYDTVDS